MLACTAASLRRLLLLLGLAGATAATAQAQTPGVGIGTTAPDASAALDIVSSNKGVLLPRVANATAIASPAFTVTSDRRFKTNVRPLGGALAAVLALRGVRYEWNALGIRHGGTAGAGQVGLIAQELEAVYPELVLTDAAGFKSVNYAQLAPVLIEALKELAARNATLEAGAAADHASLLTLQAQMARLLGQDGAAPAGAQACK